MAHEARITEPADTRRPGAPTRSAVVFGLALRLTLVGAAVSFSGLVFLLRGGLDPVVALTMTLGGAALGLRRGPLRRAVAAGRRSCRRCCRAACDDGRRDQATGVGHRLTATLACADGRRGRAQDDRGRPPLPLASGCQSGAARAVAVSARTSGAAASAVHCADQRVGARGAEHGVDEAVELAREVRVASSAARRLPIACSTNTCSVRPSLQRDRDVGRRLVDRVVDASRATRSRSAITSARATIVVGELGLAGLAEEDARGAGVVHAELALEPGARRLLAGELEHQRVHAGARCARCRRRAGRARRAAARSRRCSDGSRCRRRTACRC